MLAVLLAALDQTIVATALPKISSDFDASDEIGWVCTIFFKVSCVTLAIIDRLLFSIHRLVSPICLLPPLQCPCMVVSPISLVVNPSSCSVLLFSLLVLSFLVLLKAWICLSHSEPFKVLERMYLFYHCNVFFRFDYFMTVDWLDLHSIIL